MCNAVLIAVKQKFNKLSTVVEHSKPGTHLDDLKKENIKPMTILFCCRKQLKLRLANINTKCT